GAGTAASSSAAACARSSSPPLAAARGESCCLLVESPSTITQTRNANVRPVSVRFDITLVSELVLPGSSLSGRASKRKVAQRATLVPVAAPASSRSTLRGNDPRFPHSCSEPIQGLNQPPTTDPSPAVLPAAAGSPCGESFPPSSPPL